MKYAATVTPFYKPVRKTAGAAGTDVCLQHDLTLAPIVDEIYRKYDDGTICNKTSPSLYRPTYKIDLGFKAIVPEGFVALALPRSGLGSKGGIIPRNLVGVIDWDYRGNWFLYMYRDCVTDIIDAETGEDISMSEQQAKPGDELTLKAGTRIAQVVIVPVNTEDWEDVSVAEIESNVTERGEGGFGASGLI